MTSSSSSLLDLCLQPAIINDRETFFRDYFLKKPLHTKMPGRFDRHFRLADLEFLWNTTMRVDPDSMLFFHQPTNPDGPISSIRSPFFAFSHQISVVVNKADRLSPAILKICNNFESHHFPFVYCNVYSTPAGQRTVPVHVDDRDVFILQVHGAKHWTIYETPPIVLPYKSEELGKNQENSPDEKFDIKTAKIAFEGILEAGDVVYLPRGFAHVAKAVEHSASVHLTIAVQTSDWDVKSVLKDGFESVLKEMARKGAVSGDVAEKDRPAEFGLRKVLPPSLLLPGDTNNNNNNSSSNSNSNKQEMEEFTSQLQSSLKSIMKQLTEDPQKYCLDQFNNRLALKRQQREEYYEEHVSGIRFFPLNLNSLLMWANSVQIVQVTPLFPSGGGGGNSTNNNQMKKLGDISHMVILQRKILDHDEKKQQPEADTMKITVSSTILEVLFLWQKHFSECPAPISEIASVLSASFDDNKNGEEDENSNNNNNSEDAKKKKLPMKKKPVDCSLAAISTAGFLLRNGCFVRVS